MNDLVKHSIEARLKLIEVKLDCLLEASTREEERLSTELSPWCQHSLRKELEIFMDTIDLSWRKQCQQHPSIPGPNEQPMYIHECVQD